jgi:signal transduction histidine kinase
VKLTIDCPDQLPAIWADGTRVRSAIFEIVRNAIEAVEPRGSVHIAVSVAPKPPGTPARQAIQWVSITVTDSGPGIPEEIRDRIFQPFYTTKKRLNATGLGLTVAAGFVQQMGGVLRHESEPGKTSFQMLLPSRTEEA